MIETLMTAKISFVVMWCATDRQKGVLQRPYIPLNRLQVMHANVLNPPSLTLVQ